MTRPIHLIYDVIIIGAGAAGMMAAISARRNHPNHSIAILDRTFAVGRKLLVCGGGRCNLTNLELDQNTTTHFHGSTPHFIASVFNQFKLSDIKNFFEELGIALTEDRRGGSGKLFPLTNQAQTVTSVLLDELVRDGVQLFLNTECTGISTTKGTFHIETASTEKEKERSGKKQLFMAHSVILAAGGKTYPALGSDGSGYKIASSFGHKIVTPVPASLPLTSKNRVARKLQGLKVEAEVTSYIGGRIKKSVVDDLLFTKYGLSGSAILAISRDFSKYLKGEERRDCKVMVNFMPGKRREEALTLLKSRWLLRPDQELEKSLFGLVPNKVAPALLETINLGRKTPVKGLSEDEKRRVASALTEVEIEITGTKGWNEAEFTAGGVIEESVNPRTLQSKLQKNLYFCGEILDVDGEVGGYNLSWCWSSGWVAGKLLN